MKYRKKPVVIDAYQWTGNIKYFGPLIDDCYDSIDSDGGIIIKTLEGNMKASLGDWVIKGVNGEHYPCKPDIFEKTYELAE